MLALRTRLDQETKFMMMEPGERTGTPEQEGERLGTAAANGNPLILVAEADDGRLVGFLAAAAAQPRRARHSAYIVIGILLACAGQGIGTRLFEAMEAWARAKGLHRLELTVMAHNQAGIALYEKMGFEIEGTKRHSLRVDGAYVDEYYMARLLP